MTDQVPGFAIQGLIETLYFITVMGFLLVGKEASPRNFLVVVALLVGSGKLWLAVQNSVPQLDDQSDVFVAGPAYAALYLSLAIIVARVSRLRALGPRASIVIAYFLVCCLGVGGSLVLARAIQGSTIGPSFERWNLLNPLIGMGDYIEAPYRSAEVERLLWLLVTTAVVATLVALGMLVYARLESQETLEQTR